MLSLPHGPKGAYLQGVPGLALKGEHIVHHVPVSYLDAIARENRFLARSQTHSQKDTKTDAGDQGMSTTLLASLVGALLLIASCRDKHRFTRSQLFDQRELILSCKISFNSTLIHFHHARDLGFSQIKKIYQFHIQHQASQFEYECNQATFPAAGKAWSDTLLSFFWHSEETSSLEIWEFLLSRKRHTSTHSFSYSTAPHPQKQEARGQSNLG